MLASLQTKHGNMLICAFVSQLQHCLAHSSMPICITHASPKSLVHLVTPLHFTLCADSAPLPKHCGQVCRAGHRHYTRSYPCGPSPALHLWRSADRAAGRDQCAGMLGEREGKTVNGSLRMQNVCGRGSGDREGLGWAYRSLPAQSRYVQSKPPLGSRIRKGQCGNLMCHQPLQMGRAGQPFE